MLQDLVARGVVTIDGAGRSTTYSLASSEGTAERGSERATGSRGIEEELELREEVTVAELVGITGLTERQVRYGLSKLKKAGRAVHDGGKPARWRVMRRLS